MSDQQILDNAPEGATHVDYDGFYLRAGKSGYMTMEDYDDGRDWDYEHADICHTRSLTDIKRIVELESPIRVLLSNSSFGVNFPTECEMLESSLSGGEL